MSEICAAGWNVGVALQHYRCHTIVAKATRAAQISDTVEFRHYHLTQPTVTPMDRIFHGMNKLTCALHDDFHIACDNQLFAIEALHQAIQRWTKNTGPPQTNPHRTMLPHTRTQSRSIRRIGRSIEHCRVRVCGSVVRCGFFCVVIVVFVHRWMAWWGDSIANS